MEELLITLRRYVLLENQQQEEKRREEPVPAILPQLNCLDSFRIILVIIFFGSFCFYCKNTYFNFPGLCLPTRKTSGSGSGRTLQYCTVRYCTVLIRVE